MEFNNLINLNSYCVEHKELLDNFKILNESNEITENVLSKELLGELIKSYSEFIKDLQKTNSDVETSRRLCKYDYSKLRNYFTSFEFVCNKVGKSKPVEPAVKIISSGDSLCHSIECKQKLQQLEDENTKLLTRIEELEECERKSKEKSSEDEVEMSRKIFQLERELEELYKKYANENSEKEHIKTVFESYLVENASTWNGVIENVKKLNEAWHEARGMYRS